MPDLLNNDYIFITKQGLTELEAILEARKSNYFRNKKQATDRAIAKWKESKIDPFEKKIIAPIVTPKRIKGFSDKKKVDVTTDALRRYLKDFNKMQKQVLPEAQQWPTWII